MQAMPDARRQLHLPVALTRAFCYPEGALPHEVCYQCGRPKEDTWQAKSALQPARICCRRFGSDIEAGPRTTKFRILDEFVAVTGYHRKHAIRLFKAGPVTSGVSRRARLPLYDEAVREAVVVLWEASDRVCGKRLKPLLPILVSALERHGHLTLASAVRARVLAASAATLDRLLTSTRAAVSGHRLRRRALPAVQRNVPVRTFADWDSPLPGDMEADLVSHGGESAAGSFVHTLTLTDVASGWTECVALVVRDGALVVAALEQLRTRMPFPLRGFDTDNGGEFMNETVAAYCREHGIPCTRSRPYHKNDQAWVEQKNGSVVRRLVGYRRLEGLAAAEALSRLYAASRLFVNFFQPSFKLASKARVGAKVRKTYHAPETPCAKLLASAAIPEEMKDPPAGGGHPARPLTAPGGDPLRATPPRGTGRRSAAHRRLATRATLTAFSEGWPRRGNRERSGRPIAASPGRRAIGARDPTPSRRSGHACKRGSRPSPIASAKYSSRDFRANTPASSPTASCARFSAGSRNGGTPPRAGWSSRRHRMPHERPNRVATATSTPATH